MLSLRGNFMVHNEKPTPSNERFIMIKRKLIAAKDWIVDHNIEIGLGATVIAITALAAVTDIELDETVVEKSKEVLETATHTIVLIEK